MSAERTFTIPDDPADRPRRIRTAARVVLLDPDDRVLLFRDSDPGLPQFSWWVTPGGGVDPGESDAEAAVREVAEETGAVIAETDLIGPVARRLAVHGYSDQILEQAEVFFLARVAAFEVDVSAFTEEEKLTMLGHRWWPVTDVATTDEWIWPRQLGQLIEAAGTPEHWPIELGTETEESTRSV